MVTIIGGRTSILNQIPDEIKKAHPRLAKPLDETECGMMLEQALSILEDSKMEGSHTLFADIIRLILALQLSVSESNFGKEKILPNEKEYLQSGGILIQ